MRVRWSEIDTSLSLIGHALTRLEHETGTQLSVPVELPEGEAFGLGWAEAPQGEALHAVTLRDGDVVRCFARSASLHNLVSFHDAFHTDIFTDFAFIEASFGLGYAGVAM
jgi:Ni,Fe-hydrogenase III large subunit